MQFSFSEKTMEICLKANDWNRGWDGVRWVHINMNSDHVDYSLKDAFSMLLTSKNLYGKQFEEGWKL